MALSRVTKRCRASLATAVQNRLIIPDGVTWWQVKFCGEDGDGNQCTPFSNVISFGPVPA
jgi:hypothetical protein